MNDLFSIKLRDYSSANGLDLSNKQEKELKDIYEMTQKWSKKINITKNLSCDSFILENIMDPAKAYYTYIEQFGPISGHMIDMGCGGGYVGFIWHILGSQGQELTLLDSDRKKINFCRDVIRFLGLARVNAVQERVEDNIQNKGSHYELILSRATWDTKTCLNHAQRLCSSNGKSVIFKGKIEGFSHQITNCKRLNYYLHPNNIQRILIVR